MMDTSQTAVAAPDDSASGSRAGMKSILLVDDNPWIRDAVAARLMEQLDDVVVTAAGSGREAFDIVMNRPVDMLITEVDLPGMDGYELIGQARRQRPGMPIVVTTDDCSRKVVELLKSLGVNRWIEKPFDGKTITAAVRTELGGLDGR